MPQGRGKGKKRSTSMDEEDHLSSSRVPRSERSEEIQSEFDRVHEELTRPIKAVEDKWKLLPTFLRVRGLVRQHIDSFNHFVNVDMKKILLANRIVRSEVNERYFLRYMDVEVGTPSYRYEHETLPTNPHLCRLMDFTYSAPVYAQIEYMKRDGPNEQLVSGRILLCHLPIMLRSEKCVLHNRTRAELSGFKECPYDPGGYFIVKGVEKVVLVQEQLSQNRIIVETDPRGGVTAAVTSSTVERKSRTVIGSKGGRLHLRHNTIGEDIPIFAVFKAMGILSDTEIVSMIGYERAIQDALAPSIEECSSLGLFTQKQCMEYLGVRIKARRAGKLGSSHRQKLRPDEEAWNVLASVLLNHVPCIGFNFGPKAIFLAHMVRRVLLTQSGALPVDDKDYYGNKRLELAGQLLGLVFDDALKRYNDSIRKHLDKLLSRPRNKDVDTSMCGDKEAITNALTVALATGNWTLRRLRMERSGVTQQLSRLSYMSALGMMTRVNSQFEKTRKVSGPRALQPSQWGMLCPSDTPEGEACGLVKNLALLTHVTTESDPEPVRRLCFDLGTEDAVDMIGEQLHCGAFLVHVNGVIVGVHRRPLKLAERLRDFRRRGYLAEYISVYVHVKHRAVYVATDGGRVCRPLIIVDRATRQSRLTQAMLDFVTRGLVDFEGLLRMQVVEYVDVNEENNCLVALRDAEITDDTTHVEIDPLTILGAVAGLIPYPHHNQSPRNTYQCAMGKQAMGTIGYNQYERIDTVLYTLMHPQRPLVATHVLDMVRFEEVPAGHNAIVAVMSYSGYDIEDAIILNKASLDRGFGRCFVFRKHVITCKGNERITGRGLGEEQSSRRAKLDIDGIVRPGMHVDPRDVLVSREVPKQTGVTGDVVTGNVDYKPSPLVYKGPKDMQGVIDRVAVSESPEEFSVKVLVRQMRRPELGDKFSSRHGQKGVCGLIVDQVDLPHNRDGIVPDLIMNPHGFPSRMTVGKMMELVSGKAAVLHGKFGDGTAFAGDPIEETTAALVRAGYHYGGKEVLYSGMSGTPLRAFIFFGPVYYQKLKHMVADKIHARAKGPRAGLTRQPTEGRSRDGGLRLGEMERDCLIGYGASMLLLERLMISSDYFEAQVCTGKECGGLLGYGGWCRYCNTGRFMRKVAMPYACKLLFQELQSMNIVPRLEVSDL